VTLAFGTLSDCGTFVAMSVSLQSYLNLNFAERENIVFSLSTKGSSNHIGMQRLLAYIKSE
jgi:hypothetical protein